VPKSAHPYHYTTDKNPLQRLIDVAVPLGLLLIYFNFYNFGKISPSEIIKTSGLMAISLLALTLVVGPLARFIPSLDVLKAHRKFWGICSFFFLAVHVSMVVIYYMQSNVLAIFDSTSPKYEGIILGFLAFLVMFVVTLSSTHAVISKLDPRLWKAVQMTSYIALILAVLHFYLVEQVNGVLAIKRELGKLTLYFAVAVVFLRLLVLMLPGRRR
jgi:methionine sulfoxide reductase heme-binding subunit